MFKLFIYGLISLLSLSTLHADPAFVKQEESAQHLLQNKGDNFRFFRHNMICDNWDFAKFDKEDKTDAEDSLHLADSSQNKGVTMRLHNPVAIQPYTKYRFHFKYKVNAFKSGQSPSASILLFDFNRDYINTLTETIPVSGKIGKGWLEHKFIFKTSHEVHALMQNFASLEDTVCDIVFDEVYVEQLSEAGALRPPGRTLLSLEEASEKTEFEYKIKASEQACRFQFNFSWKDYRIQQVLSFEWLSANG